MVKGIGNEHPEEIEVRPELISLYVFEQAAAGRLLTRQAALQELRGVELLPSGFEQLRGIRPSLTHGAVVCG